MSVSQRIRQGLIKPGSIYARFAELTPFQTPLEEQRTVWKARGAAGGWSRVAGAAGGCGEFGGSCPGSWLRPLTSLAPARRPARPAQECGLVEEATKRVRQPWPPSQMVHGTVLAQEPGIALGPEPGAAAAAADAAAAGAATDAAPPQQEPPQQQQGAWLAGLGAGADVPSPSEVLALSMRLALAAAGGALAALYFSGRRAAKGTSLLPVQLVSVAAHAAPSRRLL